MKTAKVIVWVQVLLLATAGCEDLTSIDNYDAPNSTLTGRVVFDGQGVGVRSNGVQLELWEPAYPLRQKIPIFVAQDGTFSAKLFDGSYKLNLLANNGPWVNTRDTIGIALEGSAHVDVPVRPYYTVQSSQLRHNTAGGGSNGTIEGTFT